MKEALFILVVIGVLLAFTAIRYRRQIAAFIQFWNMLKAAQKNGPRSEINGSAEVEKGPLVNCAKCGTWISESKAIRLGTRIFYCSSACMEKAAKVV